MAGVRKCGTLQTMSTLQEVTQAAMRLPLDQRTQLIEVLHESIDAMPPLDPDVRAEALRRWDDIRAGRAQPISPDEMFTNLESKYPWLKSGCTD